MSAPLYEFKGRPVSAMARDVPCHGECRLRARRTRRFRHLPPCVSSDRSRRGWRLSKSRATRLFGLPRWGEFSRFPCARFWVTALPPPRKVGWCERPWCMEGEEDRCKGNTRVQSCNTRGTVAAAGAAADAAVGAVGTATGATAGPAARAAKGAGCCGRCSGRHRGRQCCRRRRERTDAADAAALETGSAAHAEVSGLLAP